MFKMTDDDQTDLKTRLASLKSGLEAKKATDQRQTEAAAPKAENMGQAMSLGIRVLSEFVAAIIVGGLLGWQFDKWLGTTPVLLLIFLLLGIIAGFWNVYRIAAAPTKPGQSGHKTKE